MEASVVEAVDTNRRVASVKMNRKVMDLQRRKKVIEEQISDLQQRLIRVLESFAGDDEGPIVDRKVKLFLSCLASIFSVSIGIRTNFASTTCKVSWPLVIGGGSIVYSLYCLQSLVFTNLQRAKARELRVFLLKLAVESVKEMPQKYKLDDRFRPCLKLGMPANLFAAMLKEDESEELECP